ncbi:MAG: 6-phosphogluconolactonase [Solirubrobacteraceae bacterium]
MSLGFEIVDDPGRACAALMVGAAIGGGEIVLAGGSTPKAAYGHFVDTVTTVGLNLDGTTFWIGDERCVEPDDERSNYRMIKQSLIDPLQGVTTVDVRRIRGELGPVEAAEEYDQLLRQDGGPNFDLVLLGIGPDGHTASLFPGQATVQERLRLAVAVPEAGLEPFVPRVSLTVKALSSAQRVVFLASGGSKADAIVEAFGDDAEPDPAVPASLLVPDSKLVTVLLDRAAAARLGPRELADE